MNIAIFYHCLFCLGGNPIRWLPSAGKIIGEQMDLLKSSGLADAASEIIVGINGGVESQTRASALLPSKSRMVFHGLESRAENLTIVEIEKWAPSHPGWAVLYFHAKGATHDPGNQYGDNVSGPWRRGMMQDLVLNWRQCLSDLEAGYDSVGCHFMRHMADGTQNIWAGNFWWANSSFLATLPSIYLRDRIKTSGISNLESRYEAEVWIGNGKMPNVKEYRPAGGGGVP